MLKTAKRPVKIATSHERGSIAAISQEWFYLIFIFKLHCEKRIIRKPAVLHMRKYRRRSAAPFNKQCKY